MSTIANGARSVDRNTVSPLLFKLFYKVGRHNSVDEFHSNGPNPPYVELYTWIDATIDELALLVAQEIPHLLPFPMIGTRLDFELIFPDMRNPVRSDGYGRYMKKPIGTIVIGAGGAGILHAKDNGDSDRRASLGNYITGDESKTLLDAKFVIGDHIGVAIYPWARDGEVASGPRGVGMRSIIASRENGYGAPQYSGRNRRGSGNLGGTEQWSGGLPTGDWRRGDPVPSPPPSGSHGRRGGGGRGRIW